MDRGMDIAGSFIVGVVATVIVFLMFFHPPVLHPVDAYCRGFSDGERHALEVNAPQLEANGVPVPPAEELDKWQEAEEVNCNTVVREAEELRTYMKGPLLP